MAKNKEGWVSRNYTVVFSSVVLVSAAFCVLAFNTGIAEALLGSMLFWNVGVQGLLAGVMHWRRKSADGVAKKIGWAPGSPFQKEVAAADAAFGVLGIMSVWVRGDFWTATAIGWAFMIFLMGVGHLIDLKKSGNRAVYNAGTVLYFDLLAPIIMLALLALWKMGVG